MKLRLVQWGPSRRSIAVSAFALAIMIIVVVVLMKSSSDLPHIGKANDIAPALTRTLVDIKATTDSLEKSFGPTITDSKTATDQYLAHMDHLMTDCKTIGYLDERTKELEVEQRVADMVSTNVRLCEDLSKVARYSANQYRMALPILHARSNTYRYESLPFIANKTISNIRKSMTKANVQLKQITIDETVDRSSTASMIQAIQANAPDEEQKDVSLVKSKLRTAQQQMLAQRVYFWQSQVDISRLQDAEQNSLNDSCAYLIQLSVTVRGCPVRE